MNEGWLAIQRVALGDQLVSNITSHAEVRVLVDGARNQTSHIGITASPEHERKRRGKGGGSLNCGECNFANVGSPVKSKDSIHFGERRQGRGSRIEQHTI